jgi:hypothetical protein
MAKPQRFGVRNDRYNDSGLIANFDASQDDVNEPSRNDFVRHGLLDGKHRLGPGNFQVGECNPVFVSLNVLLIVRSVASPAMLVRAFA